MTLVQLSPFVVGHSISRADNAVDATKTAVVSAFGLTQTLTYNAAGQLLVATTPA